MGLSGKAILIMKKPFMFINPLQDLKAVANDLKKLRRGIKIPRHRPCTLLIPRARVARRKLVYEVGFTRVSESAQLLPLIKIVPRGGILHSGRTLDTNSMRLSGRIFFSGFDEKLKDGRLRSLGVECIGSDGGLVDLNNFSGLKSAPLVDQQARRVLKAGKA